MIAGTVLAQGVPAKPDDRKMVHDYAGVIDDAQQAVMEDSLQAFAMATSNEIAVVTVTTLDGMDKAQFAQEIGQKWGVGNKNFNNGIVILVKPKTEGEKGEAFIATGYGAEGALPDAFCSRIVNDEMIPEFKEGNYEDGIWAALNIVMPVMRGEYNEAQYNRDSNIETAIGIIFCIVFFALFIFLAYFSIKNGGGGTGSGGRTYTGSGPIILGGGFGGGRSSGSSWSGGSSWGGFGGGSFGGGGGGGSW